MQHWIFIVTAIAGGIGLGEAGREMVHHARNKIFRMHYLWHAAREQAASKRQTS